MNTKRNGILAAAAALMLLPSPGAAAAPRQEIRQELLTARDMLSRSPAPADYRLAYGDDPAQIGDLRVPEGAGPHPVAILVHGGCWLEFADLEHLGHVGEALEAKGVASWSVEYRRVDMQGGGWPNTFLDVARGVDHLRELAPEHDLDLTRVIILGHSAGGHLALWAAGRPRIPETSELYSPDPLEISGVVSLGGVPELRRFRDMDEQTCGSDVIDTLMGGGPRDVPARYRAGSPFQLLPLNVPQRHITGRLDQAVPPRQVAPYNYESQSAGDDSTLTAVPEAGHFEVIWPGSNAWPVVEEAVLSLLGVER